MGSSTWVSITPLDFNRAVLHNFPSLQAGSDVGSIQGLIHYGLSWLGPDPAGCRPGLPRAWSTQHMRPALLFLHPAWRASLLYGPSPTCGIGPLARLFQVNWPMGLGSLVVREGSNVNNCHWSSAVKLLGLWRALQAGWHGLMGLIWPVSWRLTTTVIEHQCHTENNLVFPQFNSPFP